MASNRGVAYMKPGVVEIHTIPYPKLRMPNGETDPFGGKDAPHGVILKIITTNICGSDQHMVRGRTTAPQGLILGHEITGEIIEKGSDVEMLEVGDLVSVPFNIACGRCRNCREGKSGRSTATVVPSPGCESMRKLPCKWRMRSSIPKMPMPLSWVWNPAPLS